MTEPETGGDRHRRQQMRGIEQADIVLVIGTSLTVTTNGMRTLDERLASSCWAAGWSVPLVVSLSRGRGTPTVTTSGKRSGLTLATGAISAT